MRVHCIAQKVLSAVYKAKRISKWNSVIELEQAQNFRARVGFDFCKICLSACWAFEIWSYFMCHGSIFVIKPNWAFKKARWLRSKVALGFIGLLAHVVRAQHWARAYGLRPRSVPALALIRLKKSLLPTGDGSINEVLDLIYPKLLSLYVYLSFCWSKTIQPCRALYEAY